MPLQPHPYAYKTRMSAKRAPYLRPYSPPPLHLIDVVLRCAHRTTIYFGIDRFAFKFAIEDVLTDAYDYGIDFDIIGNIGERIRGVSANSLCCCRIGSSTAREGIRVGPSRANDYSLLVLPRLHRLVDNSDGAGAASGGLCGCGGRRGGSPPCCPRGGGAAGRHGAGRGARRREGGRTARIGRAAAAGGQCRCCAGVRLRGTLARCRAVPASAPCPVRYMSVSLLYRLRAGGQVGVISTPPVGTKVGRGPTNIACG